MWWICLVLLINSPRGIHGLYSGDDKVVQLNESVWEERIIESDVPAVVEFYAPWCGHCQRLAPEYKKVATALEGLLTVGVVDCDDEGNKQLCSRYQITSFPSIKVFPAERQRNPYTKKMEKTPEDYRGMPTSKGVMTAAKQALVDTFITRVASAEQYTAWAGNNDLPKSVLFTEKPKPTALYRSLSMHLRGRMAFAEVPATSTELVDEFHVEQFPTLVVVKTNGEQVAYRGELEALAMLDFLNLHAAAATPPSPEPEPAPPPAPASAFGNLTAAELEELAAEHEGMAIVGFLLQSAAEASADAPGDCTALAEFARMSNGLEGMFPAFLMRAAALELRDLEAYGVDEAALREAAAADGCGLQVVVFPMGRDKTISGGFALHSGPVDVKAVRNTAYRLVPELTTRISSSTFDSFMGGSVGGISPHSIKIILISNKQEAPGLFKVLALTNRAKDFAFGWIPMADTATLLRLFQGQEQAIASLQPPVLLAAYVHPDAKPDASGQVPVVIQAFPDRTVRYQRVQEWLQVLEQLVRQQRGEGLGADGAYESDWAQARDSADVPRINSPSDFATHCEAAASLCIIALLDARDTSQMEADLEVVKRVASVRRAQPLAFSWMDAPTHRSFATNLGVEARDIPTVLVVSHKKGRFSVMRNLQFSEQGLGQFINSIASGNIRTEPLPSDLDVGEAAPDSEGGQGGDGSPEEEVVEEEFDLAEIMSETADVETRGQRLKAVEEELLAERQKQEEAAEKRRQDGEKKKRKKKKKKQTSKANKDEL